MSDEPRDITLLHLRSIRSELSRLLDHVGGLKTELVAVRQNLASLGTVQDLHRGEIASIQSRLDRVERRLGLVDDVEVSE